MSKVLCTNVYAWENEPNSLDLPLWTDEMSQIMANVYPAVDPALPWLSQHPYFFGLCSMNKKKKPHNCSNKHMKWIHTRYSYINIIITIFLE